MMCNKLGFSLIEVTLAILVIAIGMVSIMALLPEALGLGNTAEKETEMALLATAVFADIQVQGHEDYSGTLGGYSYVDPAGRYDIPLNSLTYVTNSLNGAVSADFRVIINLQEVYADELCEVQITMYAGQYGNANPVYFYSQFANYHK